MSGALKTYSRKGVVHKVIEGANELCRLCLQKPNFSIPIFNTVPEISPLGTCIATRITMCIGLEMPQKSYLPSKICMECHKSLEKCFQFKKKCEMSYQRLLSHSLAIQNMQSKGQSIQNYKNTSKSNENKRSSEYDLENNDSKHFKKQCLQSNENTALAESLDTSNKNNSLILDSVRKECLNAKNSNATLKDSNVSNSNAEVDVDSNVKISKDENIILLNDATKSNALNSKVTSSNTLNNDAINSDTISSNSTTNNLNSNANNSNSTMKKDAVDSNEMSDEIIENNDMETISVYVDSNNIENSNVIESNEKETIVPDSNISRNNIGDIKGSVNEDQNEQDTYFVNIQDEAMMECMVELSHPSRPTHQRNTDDNRSIVKQENMKAEVLNVGESNNPVKNEDHLPTVDQGYRPLHIIINPLQPNRDPFQTATDPLQSTTDPLQATTDPRQPTTDHLDPPSSLSTFLKTVMEAVGAISWQKGVTSQRIQLREDVGEVHLMLGDGTQLIMEIEEEGGAGPRSSRECSVCGRTFASCGARLRHERAVHEHARPHVCPHQHCQRAFAQRSTLDRHLLLHLDFHPFRCELCGRGFRQRGGLISHSSTHHSGARAAKHCPYPHCPKRFMHASGLSRHIKWHEGRLFVCAVCGQVFTDKSALRRHIASDKHNRLAQAKGEDHTTPWHCPTESTEGECSTTYPTEGESSTT